MLNSCIFVVNFDFRRTGGNDLDPVASALECVAFLTTYARIDVWEPTSENRELPRNILDRWIAANCGLIDEVRKWTSMTSTARWRPSSIHRPLSQLVHRMPILKQDRVQTNWKPTRPV